jgi:hypothetical protein
MAGDHIVGEKVRLVLKLLASAPADHEGDSERGHGNDGFAISSLLLGDFEIATDLTSGEIIYLSMARHCGPPYPLLG